MRQLVIICVVTCICIGCVTEETSVKESYLDGVIYVDEVVLSGNPFDSILSTYNNNGNLLFLGVSPNLRNEEEEIRAAIRDAARQVSKYNYIKGFVGLFVAEIGSDGIVSDEFKIEWNKAAVNSLIETIKIEKVVKDKNGTYVIVSLPGTPADYMLREQGLIDGSPEWFYNIPEIEGFHVGVGATRTGRLFSESLQRADEMALASLITSFDSQFYSGVTTLDNTEAGTYDRMLVISRAEIFGFNVISRWLSPDGEYLYSLGICRSGQSFE